MNFSTAFTPEKLAEAIEIIRREFLSATWDTVYVTVLSTFFAIDVRAGLFSVLGLVAVTFIIDNALESFSSCKYFIIITDRPQPIINYILKDMDHSATLVRAEGGYSGNEKTMLHTVCRRREALRLQRFIKNTDPNAFTIITTSSEIIGSGFRED